MAVTYTVKQVAEILGYSTNSIYAFLKEGRIKGVRIGRGRFRIPAAELDRLLLAEKAGKVSSLGVLPTLTSVPASESVKPPVPIIPVKFRKSGLPSLLDWLVASEALVFGLSLLIFSRAYDEIFIKQYQIWTPQLRIILMAAGAGLFLTDFVGKLRIWWHRIFGLILVAGFGMMALVQGLSGDIDGSVIYGLFAALILLDEIFKFPSVAAITGYLLLLGLIETFLLVLTPQDVHVVAFLRIVPPFLKTYIFSILLALDIAAAVLVWFFYSRKKTIFWGVSVATGGGLLVYGYWAALELFWTRALFVLVLAAAAFLIPLWQAFVLDEHEDRGRVYLSLGVITAAFLLMSLMVRVVQQNMKAYAEQNLVDKAAYGKTLITDVITHAQNGLERAAENPLLLLALKTKKQTEAFNLARVIVENNQDFQRLLILDKDGNLLTYYPQGGITFMTSDFSFRDYFIKSTVTKKPYLSQVFETKTSPRLKVVVLAVPILDETKEVHGVLVGSFNLVKLARDLDKLANAAAGEYFELVEQNGNYLINPEPGKIGGPTETNSLAFKGKAEGQGTEVGFNPSGTLVLGAYDQIQSAGWGLAIEVPMSRVLYSAETSVVMILFMAFLIAVIAGAYLLYEDRISIKIIGHSKDTS